MAAHSRMDRGAWWAIVHGVAKSQTWLSDQHWTHTPGEQLFAWGRGLWQPRAGWVWREMMEGLCLLGVTVQEELPGRPWAGGGGQPGKEVRSHTWQGGCAECREHSLDGARRVFMWESCLACLIGAWVKWGKSLQEESNLAWGVRARGAFLVLRGLSIMWQSNTD